MLVIFFFMKAFKVVLNISLFVSGRNTLNVNKKLQEDGLTNGDS